MPPITPRNFEDLSELRVTFGTLPLPSHNHSQVLIATATGACGYGSGSNSDCTYLASMLHAARHAWFPASIVLDFRDLSYRWGDEMSDVLSVGSQPLFLPSLPTAVVISDLNREGLTSLVAQEMELPPTEWLFETVEAAVTAVDMQVQHEKHLLDLRLASYRARLGKRAFFEFYELVAIQPPHELAPSGGIVVGASEDHSQTGVWVFSKGEVWSVPTANLKSTGEVLSQDQWFALNRLEAFPTRSKRQ